MEEKKQVQRKVVEENKISTSGYDIFTLVEKNGVVLIAIADKIVSKTEFSSEEDAINYINSKPWELLINVSCVCFDLINKENNKKS